MCRSAVSAWYPMSLGRICRWISIDIAMRTGVLTEPALRHAAANPMSFNLSDLLNIFAFRPDLNLGVLISDFAKPRSPANPGRAGPGGYRGERGDVSGGGEFPVPVVQAGAAAGAITVQYREYGIRLSFVVRFTPRGTLAVHVRPEVSTIDPTKGVQVSGFNIPALATRRVETDVELAPGQSFAIAGLLDERATQDLSHIPGLANIPVLGVLFRSHSVTKNRTELVVVVTPETGPPPAPVMPPQPIRFLEPAAEEGRNETRRGRDRLRVGGAEAGRAGRSGGANPEYQELKFTLHRKLLERINLEALAGIDNDHVREEVRQAVLALVAEEPNLLTGPERRQISEEVLHEVFGLGPLEPLLDDRDDQRHPGQRLRTRSSWSATACWS